MTCTDTHVATAPVKENAPAIEIAPVAPMAGGDPEMNSTSTFGRSSDVRCVMYVGSKSSRPMPMCGAETVARSEPPTYRTLVAANVAAANVNVVPWDERPAIAYATRNVALPETRAPTDPPSDADAQVALPLKLIGPVIDRAPDAPAVRMFVEM